MRPGGSSSWCSVSRPSASGARPPRGGSFGLDEQVLNIGAAAFQPASSTTLYMLNEDLGEDGFLFRLGGIIDSWFAPLHLPTGAEVRQICVYGFDNQPGAALSASLEILSIALRLHFTP